MELRKIVQIFKNTKYQIPDTRYVFLFTLPLQLGTYFFFDFSYINGVRIDYLAPALFLTDILILLLIVQNYSIIRDGLRNRKILIAFGLLLITLFDSTSPWIGLYRFVKIGEIVVLFIVFSKLSIQAKPLLIALLLGAVLQLALAMLQITTGHAQQGLWYYLGERAFDLGTPGIATVAMQGAQILRPYGTFSHPNSMAGFYLLLYTVALFWKSQKDPTFRFDQRLRAVFIAVCTLLIFLSFSKVAIITYLGITIFYSLRSMSQCVICNASKVIVALVLAVIFLSAQGDASTADKRIYLADSALTIIVSHPLTGVGLGNYLYAQSIFPNPYPYHFLEPVHNIFLLVMSEVGIVIFAVAGYFLFPFVKKTWRTDRGKAIIIVILITGMFDHYWLTLQQNILLLPVAFGLLQNDEDVLQ